MKIRKMLGRMLRQIVRDQRGLHAVEVAVIAVIAVTFAVVGWQFLGGKVKGALQNVGNKLDQAGQTQTGSW